MLSRHLVRFSTSCTRHTIQARLASSSTTSSSTPRKRRTKTLEEYASPPVQKKGNRNSIDPDGPTDKTILPPREEWRKVFAWVPINDRVSISNADTAALVAERFVPRNSVDKIIIEAFPGPGQLTRALMALPKKRIKKLIVLESEPKYVDYLKPLAEMDPRVTIIPSSALDWDTFDLVQKQGYLDGVDVLQWDQGVHPQLQFISHLPITVYGEQLISQFLRLIPDKNWLFKYGRVKMNLLLSEYVWQRLTAEARDKTLRCKLSIMSRATAHSKLLLGDQLQPYSDHFHPKMLSARNAPRTSNRRIGVPFQAVEITPLEEQVIDPSKLDMWDYCIRRLYVRKATSLEQCIEDLGPGASSLIPKLKNEVDPKTLIRDLDVPDWTAIIREFDQWPFAPTDLGINDAMLDNYGGRGTLSRF